MPILFLTGLVLAAFLLGLFCAATRCSGFHPDSSRAWAVTAGGIICTILIAVLFFRPDEEVYSGEDPGAYFNAAVSFAQQQSLFFEDPALAELPPEKRRLFRYGHAAFLHTKDAVLWAEDETMERVGAFFFPAYSILLSVPVTLGWPYGALLLSPMLAILTGWLVVMLAYRLFQRIEYSMAAGFLYFLNPIVIWNARCLRAEWPASLLLLTGCLIWLAAIVEKKPVSSKLAFAAGLALPLAAVFHITAVFVVFPAVFLGIWLWENTRFWMAWGGGLLTGLLLFLAQIFWVTDPYWIQAALQQPSRLGLFSTALLLLFLGAFVCRKGWPRLVRRIQTWSWPVHPGQVAGSVAALGAIALILLLAVARNDRGQIFFLPAWTANYLSFTDFAGVRHMISRVWSGVVICGVLCLNIPRGRTGQYGRRLFFLLAPACFTIGWVHHYMFETRRMLTVLAPMLVLASVAVLFAAHHILRLAATRLPGSWRVPPYTTQTLITLAVIGFLAVGIRGRWPLYTTWNNQGAFRFYRSLATAARQQGDFLLAEYTQTAVPVERLSGLPLLPIAWGYRNQAEYHDAEHVMQQLVRAHPDRRFLLMSPFSGAAIAGVHHEPLFAESLHSRRLNRTRRAVPKSVQPYQLTMHVQRLRAPEPGAPAQKPYIRVMNGSKMGLSNSPGRARKEPLRLQGIPLSHEHRIMLRADPADHPFEPERLLFLFALPDQQPPERLEVAIQDHPKLRVHGTAIGSDYLAVLVPVEHVESPITTLAVSFRVSLPVFLLDGFSVNANRTVTRLAGLTEQKPLVLPGSSWQPVTYQTALVLPRGHTDRLLLLLAAHEYPGHPALHGHILAHQDTESANPLRLTTAWQWHAVQQPADATLPEQFLWHQVSLQTAAEPEDAPALKNPAVKVHIIASIPLDP